MVNILKTNRSMFLPTKRLRSSPLSKHLLQMSKWAAVAGEASMETGKLKWSMRRQVMSSFKTNQRSLKKTICKAAE